MDLSAGAWVYFIFMTLAAVGVTYFLVNTMKWYWEEDD